MVEAARLRELLERVRKAEGPDRELDAELAICFGWQYRSRKGRGREWLDDSFGSVETWVRQPPAFTASLDAITALIERELPGQAWTLGKNVHYHYWQCTFIALDENGNPFGLASSHAAATPEIAMVAAFLSAKAALAEART